MGVQTEIVVTLDFATLLSVAIFEALKNVIFIVVVRTDEITVCCLVYESLELTRANVVFYVACGTVG